jgi:hydrogenase maturation protease
MLQRDIGKTYIPFFIVKKILVLGVGNILLSDEGVGVWVIKKMQEVELPEDVELLDGGTAGLNLLNYIEGREKLIVIDCLMAEDKAGSVYRFRLEDLTTPAEMITSLHQVGIREILNILSQTSPKPETVIIGIVPETTAVNMGLSAEVEAVIPKVIELVLKEIE